MTLALALVSRFWTVGRRAEGGGGALLGGGAVGGIAVSLFRLLDGKPRPKPV
jgi:hypothetical protein